MAEGVLVIGPSGWGKSTAFRTLPPEETFIIHSDEKALPFKGSRTLYKSNFKADGKFDPTTSNYYETDDPDVMFQLLNYISEKRPDIKYVGIDTINHAMVADYMRHAKTKGFEKFVDLALKVYNLCKRIPKMRADMVVIITGHDEVIYDSNGNKLQKLRTIGKMLDEKVGSIESLFTTVLFSDLRKQDDGKIIYGFSTQTDGSNTCKSPIGMFEDNWIPNDYMYVVTKVKEYLT